MALFSEGCLPQDDGPTEEDLEKVRAFNDAGLLSGLGGASSEEETPNIESPKDEEALWEQVSAQDPLSLWASPEPEGRPGSGKVCPILAGTDLDGQADFSGDPEPADRDLFVRSYITHLFMGTLLASCTSSLLEGHIRVVGSWRLVFW